MCSHSLASERATTATTGSVSLRLKTSPVFLPSRGRVWYVPDPTYINQQSIREIKISRCSMRPAVLRSCLRPVKNLFAGSMGLA